MGGRVLVLWRAVGLWLLGLVVGLLLVLAGVQPARAATCGTAGSGTYPGAGCVPCRHFELRLSGFADFTAFVGWPGKETETVPLSGINGTYEFSEPRYWVDYNPYGVWTGGWTAANEEGITGFGAASEPVVWEGPCYTWQGIPYECCEDFRVIVSGRAYWCGSSWRVSITVMAQKGNCTGFYGPWGGEMERLGFGGVQPECVPGQNNCFGEVFPNSTAGRSTDYYGWFPLESCCSRMCGLVGWNYECGEDIGSESNCPLNGDNAAYMNAVLEVRVTPCDADAPPVPALVPDPLGYIFPGLYQVWNGSSWQVWYPPTSGGDPVSYPMFEPMEGGTPTVSYPTVVPDEAAYKQGTTEAEYHDLVQSDIKTMGEEFRTGIKDYYEECLPTADMIDGPFEFCLELPVNGWDVQGEEYCLVCKPDVTTAAGLALDDLRLVIKTSIMVLLVLLFVRRVFAMTGGY